MGHTAVSATQALSVTYKSGNMEPETITAILQISTGWSGQYIDGQSKKRLKRVQSFCTP